MNARSVMVLSALLSTSTLAATAETQAAATNASTTTDSKPRHGDCIFSRTIDDWQVLDDRTLIVYAPTRNNPYLVKLFRPGFALKSEFALGFLDRNNDGMICDGGPDYIVAREPGFSDRIPIDSVQRIDKAEAKELIAKSKSKAKPESPAVVMPDQSDMKSDKAGVQKSDQSKDQPKT